MSFEPSTSFRITVMTLQSCSNVLESVFASHLHIRGQHHVVKNRADTSIKLVDRISEKTFRIPNPVTDDKVNLEKKYTFGNGNIYI